MPEMTIAEATAFAEQAAWREVKWRVPGSQMDQHWYLIVDDTIDPSTFWAMTRLIRREGHVGEYVARYRPHKPMRNYYLELGDFVLWSIPPKQLARSRAPGQHRRLPEQTSLELGDE